MDRVRQASCACREPGSVMVLNSVYRHCQHTSESCWPCCGCQRGPLFCARLPLQLPMCKMPAIATASKITQLFRCSQSRRASLQPSRPATASGRQRRPMSTAAAPGGGDVTVQDAATPSETGNTAATAAAAGGPEAEAEHYEAVAQNYGRPASYHAAVPSCLDLRCSSLLLSPWLCDEAPLWLPPACSLLPLPLHRLGEESAASGPNACCRERLLLLQRRVSGLGDGAAAAPLWPAR